MKRLSTLLFAAIDSVCCLAVDYMMYTGIYGECEDDEPSQIYGGSYSEYPPGLIDAQFPGGEVAMRKFIAEHVEYPAQAIERGIQGTAMVTIEVGPDGSITDSWVSNEVNPLLKEAALNVVKQFPKLVPAQTDGWSNVAITMDFPIEFCLR